MITQKKCLEWAGKLPELTESIKRRVIKTIPPFHYSYRGKNYCSDCGDLLDKCTCQRKDHIALYKKRNHCERFYFNVVTTFNGVQVVRTFWLIKYAKRGQCAEMYIEEIYQNWFSNGKRFVIGKPIKFMSYDNFDTLGEWHIKRPQQARFEYDVDSWNFVIRYSDEIGRKCCSKIPKFASLIKWFSIIQDNRIETLWKIGALDNNMYQDLYKVKKYYRQVVKAHNKGYKADWIFMDSLRMMESLNMDINNPSLYLHEDSRAFHDMLMEKVNKQREKRERRMLLERQRRDLEELQKNKVQHEEYVKRVQPFFGIEINVEGLKIVPLKSIEEFYEEGTRMHHCVFSASYYEKKNSLILSARDDNNMPVETIEYDIESNTVLQCRGKYNNVTAMHDSIVNAMSKLHIYKNGKFKVT